MIKDKLMKALKKAAEAYNGGMNANAAVASAAGDADFNEKQAERLVEMFNTLATINQEKDASDPAGSCELADKGAVSKMLLDGITEKKASAADDLADSIDYAFYGSDPLRTNPTMEARERGLSGSIKQASAREEVPAELDISQRSLYKVIMEKIALLKSAGEAADDVVRNMRLKMDRDAVKIAKAIESPYAPDDMADMFKAACRGENAVKLVSEYSTKVAGSDGGMFAKAEVFDCSGVDDLLKMAEDIEGCATQIPEYEKKRDYYIAAANDAESTMLEILGFSKRAGAKESMADFFVQGAAVKTAGIKADGNAQTAPKEDGAVAQVKLAEIIRKSGITDEVVEKLAEDVEKDAAASAMPRIMPMISIPSGETLATLYSAPGMPDERQKIINKRRAMILADLMSNDPIIRDADPGMVAETYKTMVAASPRVSLDKAQVRSFLRSAVNSVAVSPSDAKVLTDVDKGMALSNIERLTNLDSSIKDSNLV